MGKKGKKAQAGKPKKLTLKEIGKRLDELVKNLEEELKGADLFAPLPPKDDCPICLVTLSRGPFTSSYQACCGKTLCVGCSKENEQIIEKLNEKNKKPIAHACPFCRAPQPSEEEYALLLEARVRQNDHIACLNAGDAHFYGNYRMRRNELKALDYYVRAVELGSNMACMAISTRYDAGTLLPAD